MWFESQNCAMMGAQSLPPSASSTSPLSHTGGMKRKLCGGDISSTTVSDPVAAKAGRWETDGDCIARLRAVAVPAASDAWRAPTPALAATLLPDVEDDFDDDDFEEELASTTDEEKGRTMVAIPEPVTPRFVQQQQHQAYNRYQPDYWQYYQPPQQQTIRCEENGKSYLELGSSPPARARCCDGRTRWCHVPCYRQRRLAVLNLSMCKLARYRQCSDPSLRRSVLICNTLRRLEREMEAEPPDPSGYQQHFSDVSPPQATRPTVPESSNYEQSLREMACHSGRATPFPMPAPDTDSGLGDDEATRPINWGSVLSLSSQTDLEALNNNELYAELGLGEPSGVEWKEPLRTEGNEWDGFVHVLVGGS